MICSEIAFRPCASHYRCLFTQTRLLSFQSIIYWAPESHCCPRHGSTQFCRENLKRWTPSPPATSSICIALRTQWLCKYHWWLAGKPTHFNPLWSTWTGMKKCPFSGNSPQGVTGSQHRNRGHHLVPTLERRR